MAREFHRPTVVYLATNLINGKRYIGVTSRSLKIRADNHWYARDKARGHAVAKAMKKYGRDMIRFTILCTCGDFSAASKEEVRLIALLKPEYNLTLGGDGGSGHHVSRRARKATSRRMKVIGAKVWAASAAAHRKPVICLKDGVVFDSSTSAAAAYNISVSAMTLHLRGINATVCGRLFSFYTGAEVPDPLHDEKVNNIRNGQRIAMLANTPRRPVICVTTGKRYGSIREASIDLNAPYHVLARIVSGVRNKSWHRLKFEYEK